jgi:hypothetical protein
MFNIKELASNKARFKNGKTKSGSLRVHCATYPGNPTTNDDEVPHIYLFLVSAKKYSIERLYVFSASGGNKQAGSSLLDK